MHSTNLLTYLLTYLLQPHWFCST